MKGMGQGDNPVMRRIVAELDQNVFGCWIVNVHGDMRRFPRRILKVLSFVA